MLGANPLDHAAIAALLPHAGQMVLLSSVETWDEAGISCIATSHRDQANPLRRGEALSWICGVEYAAQAMALHGALLSGGPSRSGYLASVKALRCHAPRLDDIEGDMRIEAQSLLRRSDSSIYSFSLRGPEALLLDGQASVFLR